MKCAIWMTVPENRWVNERNEPIKWDVFSSAQFFIWDNTLYVFGEPSSIENFNKRITSSRKPASIFDMSNTLRIVNSATWRTEADLYSEVLFMTRNRQPYIFAVS